MYALSFKAFLLLDRIYPKNFQTDARSWGSSIFVRRNENVWCAETTKKKQIILIIDWD